MTDYYFDTVKGAYCQVLLREYVTYLPVMKHNIIALEYAFVRFERKE